jgi:uncharacterized metal-binding protein
MENPLKKKVGIIACSGEELVGGTITRAVARAVVEFLRPGKTVILCQPLFMAGGLEKHGGAHERDFAKDHPVITIEGCSENCAYIAVDRYSGKPSAVFKVEDYIKKLPDLKIESREKLNDDAMKIVEIMANDIAKKVDELFENQ